MNKSGRNFAVYNRKSIEFFKILRYRKSKAKKRKKENMTDCRNESEKFVFSKLFKHKTLEERAVAYGGKIGAYEEMSWGEPMEREEGLT